jgi:hypothetical protein
VMRLLILDRQFPVTEVKSHLQPLRFVEHARVSGPGI